jgi:primosomal protein N' (replication factor Y)
MKLDDTYIDVAVALPVYKTFTYSAPNDFAPLVAVGKRVLVPFGRRRVTGYIFGKIRGGGKRQIKSVLDVLDEQPLFPSSMVPFFKWIADYYKYPIGEVVKNSLPGGLVVRDYALVNVTAAGREALQKGQATPAAARILSMLPPEGCREKELRKKIDPDIPGALLHTMEARGWIERKWELAGGRTRSRQERVVRLSDSLPSADGLTHAGSRIVDMLKTGRTLSVKELKAVVPRAAALIKPLEKAGYLVIDSRRIWRDPFGEAITPDCALTLTGEQQHAVNAVCASLGNGYATFLLQGVTGSGKTEVYLQVAAEVLKTGRTVVVLVPEIALITQIERRFRARFGECVGVLHSGLSSGERYDQWSRIRQGKATIAIGARSAIFAPVEDPGVIIVDEEHDSSYKQEGKLRYNARDLAVVRARQHGCIALLGSATPSVQSFYNVTAKKFVELRLHKRIAQRPLPPVRIVDLRQNRDARGVRRFVSAELHQAIKQTLERGEQVLLFLNRRGYASFPVCAACGQPVRCKHCDISLTLHQQANAYRCHYCGYSRSATSNCEFCGSASIKHLGLGTEKLETAVASLFPGARIARMDRDTTRRKGSVLKLLKGLQKKTIDILVGTQMIAKGHDFPNITLVGIICADLSLSFPDFRAGERTFQLLAQVAGRAGRGDAPGQVILQTYNPEHFSIAAATQQDFDAFYQQEIGFRRALAYPPFSRMIQLKVSGRNPQKTETHVRLLGDVCRKEKAAAPAQYRGLEIMGPIEASLARIADRHRWQILIKGLSARELHQFVRRLLSNNPSLFNAGSVQVVIDVDPVFMM